MTAGPVEDEAPRAEVTRFGRWAHAVIIKHGLTQFGPNGGPWIVLGRGRAERKARRELRRYVQREAWQASPTVIAAENVEVQRQAKERP